MMPREGTMIADRYRLERKVGGGRVSAVWRVRDEISSRPCAIKLLHRSMHKHPEALTRFSLEDRLARELAGPHFPERVGSGVWDGMRYIAWRWHEGESLRTLFDRNPKQDAPTVHSIVQETCQALSLVHAAGYAHGDLKPENVLFADRGDGDRSREVKLLGFGVASRLSRPSAAGFGVSRRRPGEVVGTPLYLSPDLILGRVPNGGQADLWALAVMVYEALTGRAPFLGLDIGAVLQAILEKRAPRPSSITDTLPGSFDAWWAQALAQEFDTPSEFASALTRALAPALRTSHTQRSASLPERLPERAVSEKPAPERALTERPLPERSTPAPDASPRLSAPIPRVNASTATGIGPTDMNRLRAAAGFNEVPSAEPRRAPASLTAADPASLLASVPASVPPEARGQAESPQADASARDAFAPLPSPLRDLGADGSRKTLVGITPPILLRSPQPAATASSALPLHAVPQATPQQPARNGSATNTIEGAPCKPIDMGGAHSLFDAAGLGEIRRPANPTVPFPRPRVAPRHSSASPGASGDETPDIGRASWHGTTTRTLRFMLAIPDHKPQWVAAALVCAAAAIVIFILGRSPVAGTAGIGQSTEALSAEPGQRPAISPVLADPTARSEIATVSGSGSSADVHRSSGGPTAREPAPLEDEELAPGLVVPASEPGGQTRPASEISTVDAAAPSAAGNPSSRPAAPPASRPPVKKPTTPASLPTPAPRKSSELDFGI
jgi:serine/threonine protein kinase